MAKKVTLSLTDNQMGLLRMALCQAIELDETFYVDGLTRDAQAAADYRGLQNLLQMIDDNRLPEGINPFTGEKIINGGVNPFTGEKVGA